MVEKITVKLPAELAELAGLSSKRIEEKSLLIWIFELYSMGKITLSKAANIVQMKIDEFLLEFYKRHFKHIGGPETVQEANEDFDIVQKLTEDQ